MAVSPPVFGRLFVADAANDEFTARDLDSQSFGGQFQRELELPVVEGVELARAFVQIVVVMVIGLGDLISSGPVDAVDSAYELKGVSSPSARYTVAGDPRPLRRSSSMISWGSIRHWALHARTAITASRAAPWL